jgi:hypothetical protein
VNNTANTCRTKNTNVGSHIQNRAARGKTKVKYRKQILATYPNQGDTEKGALALLATTEPICASSSAMPAIEMQAGLWTRDFHISANGPYVRSRKMNLTINVY